MPRVNSLLLIAVMLLVLMFRSSSASASAYGISVTGTMVVTAMMGFVVIWKVWKWSAIAAAALIAPFLVSSRSHLPCGEPPQSPGGRLGAAVRSQVADIAVDCGQRRNPFAWSNKSPRKRFVPFGRLYKAGAAGFTSPLRGEVGVRQHAG